jgi:hypothetical protein
MLHLAEPGLLGNQKISKPATGVKGFLRADSLYVRAVF